MFDKDFIFGASTAAYQIEGYTNVDGRTDSICRHEAVAQNRFYAVAHFATDAIHVCISVVNK